MERTRALGFLFLAAAVALSIALLGPRFLAAAGGVDVELAAALKDTEPEGLSVQVPGSEQVALSRRHAYTRVVFPPVEPGQPARLVATLDFSGSWGKVSVASLGREELTFRREGAGWKPASGWAPRLSRALATLAARRAALERGDRAALERLVTPDARGALETDVELRQLLRVSDRRYRVDAWYLRFERDQVLISEEYRLSGTLPERPVDERGTRRLTLISAGDEFLFSPPLM